MGRSAAMLASTALALAACTIRDPPRPSERAAAELARVRSAMGEIDPRVDRHLRYRVRLAGEAWTYEIYLGGDTFAERRTRADGAGLTFGVTGATAWVRARDRDPVEVDGDFASEAVTRRGLFALRFARPGPRDSAEMLPSDASGWELSFRADGGATLGLRIDRERAIPTAFDWVDRYERIQRCDDARWSRSAGGGAVLEHARCTGIIHEIGRHVTTLDLEDASNDKPAWAAGAPKPLVRAWAPVSIPIEQPHRVYVPVRAGGASASMILDSGAGATVLGESAALALGVVPTGEPPIHMVPPWLAEQIDWVGMLDRVEIGGMALHGVRVLVTKANLGDGDGLLGFDFFRRAIVDVDSPSKTLRLWARESFAPPPGGVSLPVWGTSHREWAIHGEVARVGDGEFIVDTGAPLDVVVHHPRMAIAYPRHRGDDVSLAAFEQEVSPDYLTEIDGMKLGPFSFPRMGAYGRDRERKRIGEGMLGLVGMGLLRHFRVAFDAHEAQLRMWPGDGYETLRRAGLEIEERDGRAIVTRIVPRGPASALAHLRVGDAIVAVDGKPVRGASAAMKSIASAGPSIRLGWQSYAARRTGVIAAAE